jgi:signal transduction histidine kinase
MAAVVAHEVRNPLAGVRGALQVLGSRLAGDTMERAVVRDMLARLDGLDEMIRDLLLYARPRPPKLMPVDVTELLAEKARHLGQIPEFEEVQVRVSGDGGRVMADGELLTQAVFNVLLNAAQAMNGRGRIDVATFSVPARCRITIHDTGPGIPDEIRPRAFEPFFSTKHRGTGLGLAIAKRAVELNGGSIDLDCPPEGGTRVTIDLPVAG